MTPEDTAHSILQGLDHEDRAEFEALIEQAITAAVEEDRKTRPHEFVGRSDRWCELCDKPDRDAIHLISRERLSRSIDHAVEAEREACAQTAERCDKSTHPAEVADLIRARSTASAHSTLPAD